MKEDLPHLVFVYGTLRRGASNAFRMEGGEFVRPGCVRGRLYRIDWYPGLVLDPEGGWVVGELWRVGADKLAELDEFEGLPAGRLEGTEYRRVEGRVMECVVDPERWSGEPAWMWEWRGDGDEARRIASGDWLDEERPPGPPVLTGLGCLSLAFLPVGYGVLAEIVSAYLTRPGGMIATAGAWVVAGLTPVVAWTLSGWGERKRERCAALQGVTKALSLIAGVLILIAAVAAFAGWWARREAGPP